jgi:hypothetical protein
MPPVQTHNKPKIKILASLSVAILFIVGAAYAFSDALASAEKFPPWGAMWMIGLALLALLFAYRSMRAIQPPVAPAIEAGSLPVSPWQAFFLRQAHWLKLGASIGVTLYVLWRLPVMTIVDGYGFVFIAWLVAIALFVSFLLPAGWSFSLKMLWSDRRFMWSIVALTAFAFFLRAWQVGSLPFTLAGDEASQGLESVSVLDGVMRNPFSTGWLSVPNLSFFYNSITVYLFGQTTFGLRFAWVLIGTATVVVVFFLVRRVAGKGLAWATAIMLAAYHYHIHFSRLGSNQVADPFFMALSLLFLVRALDDNHRIDWALSGIAAALALYFYAGARLTPIIVIAILGYTFLRQPREFFKKYWPGLLSLIGGFLIAGAPMIQYAIRFPDDFNARVNQVGIIQSGWLEREIGIRGQSMTAILWDQFQRAALAFNFYPDRTVWYGLRGPLLDPFFGVIFLLGLGYITLKLILPKSNPRLVFFAAWWWGGVILGGMLTESPPSSQRLITLSVPVCFFIAFVLWKFARLSMAAFSAIKMRTVVAVGVLAFCLISLNAYFFVYTPQRIYGGNNAQFATMISPRLNELKYDNKFFFLGSPFMYWGFSTLPYLVPAADALDLPEDPITAPLNGDFISVEKGAVFIIYPARQNELGWIIQSFPGGRLEAYHHPVDNSLLGMLYIILPASGR